MRTSIAGNALQIDTYNGCALFSPVWFGFALVASHSPTLVPFPQITLFAICLLRWRCIMIVFKMASIRCNAHIRCHFRSYKTSYKSIFLYILYIIYIGTFNVTETIFCTCTTIYPVVVYTFMS